jgi:ankyrin repeat protein
MGFQWQLDSTYGMSSSKPTYYSRNWDLIIEETVDVNTTNAFGETPLYHACSANNVFAVKELKNSTLIEMHGI